MRRFERRKFTNSIEDKQSLDDALLQHCGGNFHKACDVGSLHIVHATVRLGAVFDTLLVDGLHYEVQLLVHFFPAPADVGGILGHLQA